MEYPAQQQSRSSLHPMGRLALDLALAPVKGSAPTMVSVDRAWEATETAWADQAPELMTVVEALAMDSVVTATASNQVAQVAWVTDSVATVLAVPSSRPSPSSPSRELGSALGRSRAQETRL